MAMLPLLAGCSFANGPTVAESQIGAVPQDRGRLYVYRPYNYIGSAASPTISVDNVPIGPAHLVGALNCDLAPGNYVVSAVSPGVPPFPISARISAGQSTYLQVSPGFNGWNLSAARPDTAGSEVQSMHLTPAICPSSEGKPGVTVSSRQADDVLARGAEAEQRGDFAAALSIYTEALQKRVTRFDAVPDVVDRAKVRADLAVARREYANALALAPWWADVWFNLAKVDEQLGSTADVRRDLTWYLRAAPDAPDRDQIRRQIEALR